MSLPGLQASMKSYCESAVSNSVLLWMFSLDWKLVPLSTLFKSGERKNSERRDLVSMEHIGAWAQYLHFS